MQKGRISSAEQSRLFVKGLSDESWHKIFHCLLIKAPDHNPDDFWPLEGIRSAGEYVLNGADPLIIPMCAGISSSVGTSSGAILGKMTVVDTPVKKEDFVGILDK